jgi:hypothetical protein
MIPVTIPFIIFLLLSSLIIFMFILFTCHEIVLNAKEYFQDKHKELLKEESSDSEDEDNYSFVNNL